MNLHYKIVKEMDATDGGLLQLHQHHFGSEELGLSQSSMLLGVRK